MLWCGYFRAGPFRFTASFPERGAEKRLRAVNSTPTGSRHGHEPVGVDFNDEGTAVGATGAPFAGAHPLGLHEFAQPAQPVLKYNVYASLNSFTPKLGARGGSRRLPPVSLVSLFSHNPPRRIRRSGIRQAIRRVVTGQRWLAFSSIPYAKRRWEQLNSGPFWVRGGNYPLAVTYCRDIGTCQYPGSRHKYQSQCDDECNENPGVAQALFGFRLEVVASLDLTCSLDRAGRRAANLNLMRLFPKTCLPD